MTIIELGGCRTRPIGSYLKALGILRLVGEQLDPGVSGSWTGDSFRLETAADNDALVAYFLDDYAPTPLVSPWNGGSGFSPKDKAAIKAITAISGSEDVRFADYRATIERARELVADPSWGSGGRNAKLRQIALCRSTLPDRAVEWVDSSVVLANDRAVFPPLFGTGGNDGRLEFSSNFMQRLVELLIEPRRRSAPTVGALLENALFGADGALETGTSGQYDPASIDPGTTSASGNTTSLSNPWDFILLIEGGLVFASAAARRLGTGANVRAAMPFCVDSSPVGSASSADGEEARGEIWAPVWRQPATVREITRLIGEGRAQWGRGQAGNGVDFAKAVATLGVDRGIDRFVRHGVVQRNGLAFFSVPLGEVAVGSRPQVEVLIHVDSWLRRLKRQLPAAAATARRRVETAEYRAVTRPNGQTAPLLQQVLIELADLESTVGRSSDRFEMPHPVGGGAALAADDWLPNIDDGTPELRIAAALASARDNFRGGELDQHTRTTSSLALSFRPVQLSARGRIEWAPGPPRIGGIEHRPIQELLADALVDREIRLSQRGAGKDETQGAGIDLWFDTGLQLPPGDLLDLAEGRVDLLRLRDLFRGLLLLDWRRRPNSEDNRYKLVRPSGGDVWTQRTSPAMATLLPFFYGEEAIAYRADGSETSFVLRPQPGWARQLVTGRVGDVLKDAVHRLRIEGLRPAVDHVRPTPAEADGALAIAALCRISARTIGHYIRQTCPTDSQISEAARHYDDNTKEQP